MRPLAQAAYIQMRAEGLDMDFIRFDQRMDESLLTSKGASRVVVMGASKPMQLVPFSGSVLCARAICILSITVDYSITWIRSGW